MDNQQTFYVVMTSIISAAVALTAPWLAYFWHRTRLAEQSAVLKKAMLDRGFTPEQILQVIEAGAEKPAEKSDDLFRTLTDNMYNSDHIQAILAAMDRAPAELRDQLRRQAKEMAESWYDGQKIAEYIDSRTASAARPKPKPESAYA